MRNRLKIKYIYKWNGEYFGFISGDNLFDTNSNWIGWIEDKGAWRANGEFLGEIYDNNYILRNRTKAQPLPKPPHNPPICPIPPVPSIKRDKREPLAGLYDALEGL